MYAIVKRIGNGEVLVWDGHLDDVDGRKPRLFDAMPSDAVLDAVNAFYGGGWQIAKLK